MLKGFAMTRIHLFQHPEGSAARRVFYDPFLRRPAQRKLEFGRAREQLVPHVLYPFQVLFAARNVYLVGRKYYRLCALTQRTYEFQDVVIVRVLIYFSLVHGILDVRKLDSETCQLTMDDNRELFSCCLHPFREGCQVSFQYAQNPIVNLLFQEFYIVLRVTVACDYRIALLVSAT